MKPRRVRRVVTAVLVAAIVAVVSPAWAAWQVAASEAGTYGKAHTMPAGNPPSVNVSGRNVTVSWTASQFPNGAAVDDYRVRRYDASSGAAQTILSSCESNVAALTCTESTVPSGDWKYSVTPRKGNWLGAESGRSNTASVGSSTLTFSGSTDISSLEATLSGNVSNFVVGQSVVFRLNDPITGPLLTGTLSPLTIPLVGSASLEVTIPKGTGNGTHTIYAVGSLGDVASETVTVNVTPPSPTGLATTNAGQTGRLEQGDTLTITYSEALDVGSICSTWSGDTSDQAITADGVASVRIRNDFGTTGNDVLDVVTTTGACGGAFKFGTIDLGGAAFVTGETYFGGSGASRTLVNWTVSSRQLSVTLGARASGPNPGRVNSTVTATYTPDPSLRNTSWTLITGTVSRTGVQF